MSNAINGLIRAMGPSGKVHLIHNLRAMSQASYKPRIRDLGICANLNCTADDLMLIRLIFGELGLHPNFPIEDGNSALYMRKTDKWAGKDGDRRRSLCGRVADYLEKFEVLPGPPLAGRQVSPEARLVAEFRKASKLLDRSLLDFQKLDRRSIQDARAIMHEAISHYNFHRILDGVPEEPQSAREASLQTAS